MRVHWAGKSAVALAAGRVSHPSCRRLGLIRGLAVSLASLAPGGVSADCGFEISGLVPLCDLGTGLYRGFPGGLYPDGQSARPQDHETEGVDRALNRVRPLGRLGEPDEVGGKVVMISVGMSNTTQEFSAFTGSASEDPAVNPKLVIVDGAQPARPAGNWAARNSSTWTELDARLATAGVTPAQVQVAWVKLAQRGYARFPGETRDLQADLEEVARLLKTKYPNIQIAYYSSRTRAYTEERDGINPEPTAYETGFAVKWMIERQVEGQEVLDFDVAPWLSWGPYLWADGMSPRSDGLVWECLDTEPDFVHPSASGEWKVADQLMAFFKTDTTSAPWFLKPAVGAPQILAVDANPSGTEVRFSVSAFDPGGIAEYLWTFGDGTFAFGPEPTKRFPVEGDYEVHLTVIDTSGNAALRTVPVSVGSPPPVAGSDLEISLEVNADGGARLTWNSDRGVRYRVIRFSGVEGHGEAVVFDAEGTGGEMSFTGSAPPDGTGGRVFYRVEPVASPL